MSDDHTRKTSESGASGEGPNGVDDGIESTIKDLKVIAEALSADRGLDATTVEGMKSAASDLRKGFESIGTGLKDGLAANNVSERLGQGLDSAAGKLKTGLREIAMESKESGSLRIAKIVQAWVTAAALVIGTIVLGIVGARTTQSFNNAQTSIGQRQNQIADRANDLRDFETNVVQRQADTAEQRRLTDERLGTIDLVQKFIPHMEADGPRRKAALLTIWRLSSADLMLELALLYGGEGAADALSELAHRNPTLAQFDSARSAFESVVTTSPELALPNVRYASETRTREVSFSKTRSEQRMRTYSVTRTVPVTKSLLVVEQDENGEIVRDDQGMPVYRTENVETIKRLVEQVEQVDTVSVPLTETVLQNYTVLVPRSVDDVEDDFLGTRLAEILSDGPKPLGNIESELILALSIPADETRLVSNLHRELLWRTKPVAGTDLVELNDREVKPVKAKAIPVDASPEYPKRRWQFISDREPLMGVFVLHDSDEVVLRIDDGSLVAVRSNEFSFRDRDWLQNNTEWFPMNETILDPSDVEAPSEPVEDVPAPPEP